MSVIHASSVTGWNIKNTKIIIIIIVVCLKRWP